MGRESDVDDETARNLAALSFANLKIFSIADTVASRGRCPLPADISRGRKYYFPYVTRVRGRAADTAAHYRCSGRYLTPEF